MVANRAADPAADPMTPATLPITDPRALLTSRAYLALLVLGALLGVPVATFAYFFLKFVGDVQKYVFTTLPKKSAQRPQRSPPVSLLEGFAGRSAQPARGAEAMIAAYR